MRANLLALAALLCVSCGRSSPSPGAAGSAQPSGSAAPVASASGPTAPAVQSASAAPAPSADPAEDAGAAAADDARLVIEGTAVPGGILKAKVSGKVKRISFPGHKTTIPEDGEFLIGFGRTTLPKETLTLTLDDGTVLSRVFEPKPRTYETDRIDGLPDSMVKLDAATKRALAKAEAKIDALRTKFSGSDCYKEKFAWPTHGRITSRYGQPRILNKTDAGIHWGVDIAAVIGTPVLAPACGKVVFAEENVPLSGTTVVIDHGRGLSSTFLHLDRLGVKVGAEVKKGQIVGRVGQTGRTTGPHLDWRMNLYDLRVDPELLVPPMGQ